MAFVEDQEASTSTQISPYKVFLSFRGEDTRFTFTSHLYTALVNAGIKTFRDDKDISRGNTIKLELEKGINQSSASVIVFSEKYASSKWCLNELAMILDRSRTSKHIVLPVFYHVEPTNIRRQSGSIGEAFADYDKEIERESNVEKKKELEENIIKWREALEHAANISGMELKKEANRDEAEFIQKVVKEVRNKLRLKSMDVPPYLVGMSSHMRDIDLWIRDAATNSSILVIVGMGGIGKTTIAKCVFNKYHEDFDGSSFVSDIKERSKQTKGLIKIQKQLLSDICNRTEELYIVDQGMHQIRDAISCKQVLLVLDDVDHISQLNAIFGVHGSLFEGSKIVITTWNENLIKSFMIHKLYKVKALRNDESVELFSFHAFQQGHPPDVYMEQTKKIVKLCEGLPLALRILGSSLIDKELELWVCLAKKLETIPEGEIVEKLKITYDSLPEDIKDIFLHIACFFPGEDRDKTVEILDACEMHALVGIDYLRDRCLLEIASNNRITMHLLVRAMGRDIVRQESPNEPGERTRLWNSKDCFDVLYDKTGTKSLQALAFHMKINSKENSDDPYFDTEAFAMMQKLKFLQLSNLELSGSYGKFPRSLRWLSWHGCNSEYVPNDLSLRRLVCLDMQHSALVQVWKDSKCLPALKILNLSHSEKLNKSPDFSKLPKLEKLFLKGCTELVEICESIISAEGLVLLDVKDCRKLTKLPRSIGNLKSLEILDISGCSGLREFPGGLINLQLLKEFCADDLDMNALLPLAKELRSWNSFPQCIRKLSLARCNLSNDHFPQDLSNLPSLTYLELSQNLFTSLPDSFQTLRKLEKLCLNHCPLLQSVRGLPRNLKNLLRVGHAKFAEQADAYYLECLQCRSLVEVEGCFKRVSIRYVDRRIKKNLGLLELEKKLIELDLYKDIKVTHEYGIFSTWVPGDELPGCFTFKKEDITGLTFIVPNNLEIQGLTVGFVYDGEPRETYFLVLVTVYNRTKDLRWNYDVISRSHISVLWLIYFKLGTLLEAGDEITISVRKSPSIKEFGFKLVPYGGNDADEEVYDIDIDHDILTSEQNNATRLSLADETFFQLSDFNIPGKFYLFGRENLVYSNID
ncbi:disease resistance protein RUN1 isoform X4 [Daucus carota subsp. sativus]|uniref:disease resistance protein RUN1 isoform X4 n=1 Tax=Daucus carota subsp. sativus TaxID=79200 RepID=UPI003082BBB7